MAAIKEKCSTIHLEFCLKNISRSSGSLTPPTLTAEEEARTWKKIDMKLMPILALLYLFSFLDRGEPCQSSLLARSSTSVTGNIGLYLLAVALGSVY